jgi:hypothetical protein
MDELGRDSGSQFRVVSFKPFNKDSLKGFLDLEIWGGVIVHGVTLFENKNGGRYCKMPCHKIPRADGTGTRYVPMLSLPTPERAEEFRKLALAAFDRFRAGVRS